MHHLIKLKGKKYMPKFFGHYLLEQDLLTKEQLLKAISYQRSKSEKLGDLAIKKGFLTKNEVAKIRREQLRTDMMFGELAVRMNYLTPEQIKELLTIQESSHIFLGEAIIELGFLSKEQLEAELEKFRQEELTESLELAMPENIPNRLFLTVLNDLAVKLFRRVADIQIKGASPKTEQYYTLNPYLISLSQITGDINGKCALKLTRNVAIFLAQQFTHNDALTDEELIGDAVGEFLNILCGNTASKLVTSGTTIEVHSPTAIWSDKNDMLQFDKDEFATVFPFFTSEGFAELLFISRTI